MARKSITGTVGQSLGSGRYVVSASAGADVAADTGTASAAVDTISALAGTVTGMATAIADLRTALADINAADFTLAYDPAVVTNANQVAEIGRQVLQAARASGRFTA